MPAVDAVDVTASIVMGADDPRIDFPFRWNLVTPDRLGSLWDEECRPDLWFAAPLVDCAARVLARSGGGPLFFVGRSLDSVYDLLSGALAGDPRLLRLPFTTIGRGFASHDEWREEARAILTRCGLTPFRLARAADPISFADVVSSGRTFAVLYALLRQWVDEEREPWDVVRRKIRFIGVVARGRTSPNTSRWQQQAGWTTKLPSGAVGNVSLDRTVYSYLADRQEKLTTTFGPGWSETRIRHDSRVRYALAEAVAVVEYGRRPETRASLTRALAAQKPYPKKWLAALS